MPLLARLHFVCVMWEQVIADVKNDDPEHGTALQEFYDPASASIVRKWRTCRRSNPCLVPVRGSDVYGSAS